MNNINFEEDRVDSVTQVDQTKNLSDKVIELRNLEEPEKVQVGDGHTVEAKGRGDVELQVKISNDIKSRKLSSGTNNFFANSLLESLQHTYLLITWVLK